MTLIFQPLVPMWVLGLIATILTGAALTGLIARRRGSLWRLAAYMVLIFALAGPQLSREHRLPQSDVVTIIRDLSSSMKRETRTADADAIERHITRELSNLGFDVRRQTVGDSAKGTALVTAVERSALDTPAERRAGVVLITDGLAHDTGRTPRIGTPVHAVIVGDPEAPDARIRLLQSPRAAEVGAEAEIKLKVEGGSGDTPVTVRLNGQHFGVYVAQSNQPLTLRIPIRSRMDHLVQLSIPVGASDLNPANNQTQTTITGMRGRLRVLLITGEPYAGVRAWRNLLKSDPAVDLVHFTILRSPDREDFTPTNELALIAFPTRTLFSDAIDNFDLIIFDRYRQTDVLPAPYLDNIANHVKSGGALFVISGPEDAASDDFSSYAHLQSLYTTPLAAILPAKPAKGEMLPAFKPQRSVLGQNHPITAPFDGQWGAWLRALPATAPVGQVLLQTPSGHPLLIVNRIGHGRVAQLMSDQAWLWARGYDGGGPYGELMRRLIHWLMGEPELDENRLSMRVKDHTLIIERQSLSGSSTAPVMLAAPHGKTVSLPLKPVRDGLSRAEAPAPEAGLYTARQDDLFARLTIGQNNTPETRDGATSLTRLVPLTGTNGGTVMRAKDVTTIRRTGAGQKAHGQNWLGFVVQKSTIIDRSQSEPLPALLLVLLAGGFWLMAWWREGR